MYALRLRCVQATQVILAVFLVIAVVLQCPDFRNATEVFPIGGFAVFLTLASFSISWSRVNPPLSTLAELKRVKRAGLDLLIATGLTLISGGLLKLAQDDVFKSTPLAMPFLVVHQLALAVGLLIGWMAVSILLSQAVNPAVDPQPSQPC
ncbi:MAG: hypothetical protein EBR33_08405 [Synechococcaceae bacterium WB4_1_0192]|nr:hypothetical protein [Synechococcaceae bacterium WB4_1_0192]